MLFSSWTRRKFQVVWAIGLFAEATLISATVIAYRRADADSKRNWGPVTHGGPSATPLQRDSALRLLRDQLGVGLDIRHDTIVGVHMTPQTERAFAAAIRQVAAAATEAAALVLAIYLAIPIALLILSVLWYRAHRPSLENLASPAAQRTPS